MPIWRCPHCGTPQAETARCWVCRRSSTTCSTCKNFRRSVAAQLGYCGLDARRAPLAGTELRGCWVAGAERSLDVAPGVVPPDPIESPEPPSPALRLRDFVPVELVQHRAAAARLEAGAPGDETAVRSGVGPDASGEPGPAIATPDRVTLFADAEL